MAKLVYAVLRLLGRGATTLPGRVALHFKYDILNTLSKNVKIICVTGTNGKTTTCALVEHIAKSNNLSYFINKSGSNMIWGVATSFVLNCNIFGKCKKQYAILECDENSFPIISRYLDADVVVVTNVFRDQLDRYGEVSTTLEKIKQALLNMPNATVVLNGDCPLTYSLSRSIDNKILTFGINCALNKTSVSDNRFCPVCNAQLCYRSFVYAHLGNYECLHCGYKKPNLDLSVNSITSLSNEKVELFYTLNGNTAFASLSIGGIYNVYNFSSAVLALSVLGINNVDSVCTFGGAFGRMEKFKCSNKEITLLLVKNPVGLSQCLSYVQKINGNFDLILSLNDKDADGRDVSWIWDASFAGIRDKCNNVYTLGTRGLDMAVRLKYDSIKVDKIIHGENYNQMIDVITNSKNNVVILSTYTSMMSMRHCLINKFGGAEFWQ